MSNVLDLTCALIRRPSVTPDDAGCQQLIVERLHACGFVCESLAFEDVHNLWATRSSRKNGDPASSPKPIFCFAGHTDVVPTGPLDHWQSDPFKPSVRQNKLYGRGAADMKGSVAAMVCAVERFVARYPDHRGQIAFLITSDEEGPAINGTKRVVETLQQRGVQIDYCLVGEPSSSQQLADVARVGRRGSLNASITVHGKQGHVAFPEKACNPIHQFAPALAQLCAEQWDQGNDYFPATTFQVSNFNSGTGVSNVIPGTVSVQCNFRFSTAVTETELKARTIRILDEHKINADIEWNLSGQPFLSKPGALTQAVVSSVQALTEQNIELSTGGGTSDGRFIAPMGTEVIELGPINQSIHQIDECVSVTDLDKLSELYYQIMVKIFTV